MSNCNMSSYLKKWCMRYLFNFDAVMVISIFLIVIYLIYTRKDKVKYQGDIQLRPIPRGNEYDTEALPVVKQPKVKAKKKKWKREEKCREIFEMIFNKPFKSIRPKWLENPATGRNLELDGFCPDIRTPLGMGLAFEHDGEQHSRYVPHLHNSNPKEFIYQDRKDAYKDQVCKKKGVLLVRIPHYVVFEDLERYIRDQLRAKGVATPSSMRNMYG